MAEVVARLGGTARTDQLLPLVTRRALTEAVEHGWEVLRQPDRPRLSVPPNRNVPTHRRRGVHLLRTGYGGTVTSPTTCA